MRENIDELIAHECQIYGITKCVEYEKIKGVIQSFCEQSALGVGLSANASLKDYTKWRDYTLALFYSKINFSKLLVNPSNENIVYPVVYKRMKTEVAKMLDRNNEPTIDQELRLEKIKNSPNCNVIKRTVAYKLSTQMFQDIYSDIINKSAYIPSSKILVQKCSIMGASIFPLTYSDLVARLECNDNEFWCEIVDIVRNFTGLLLYNNRGKLESRDEDINDINMNCVDVLREQSAKGALATKESATHFLNSIYMTCRYKWREALRRIQQNNKRYAIIDDKEWLKMEDDSNLDYELQRGSAYNILEELDLLDIDLHNNYEVSSAIVHLLLHKDNELYKSLVGSKQTDVDILMWYNMDNISYDDIAVRVYGESTDKNKAAIRKRNNRIRDWLKDRFTSIVKECRKEMQLDFIK